MAASHADGVYAARPSARFIMKHFFFKLIPPRPTFSQDMNEAEREVMRNHVAYWKSLTERGIALVFGPVADPQGAWGMGIAEMPDESSARELADNDPVTKSALGFRFDVLLMPQIITRE